MRWTPRWRTPCRFLDPTPIVTLTLGFSSALIDCNLRLRDITQVDIVGAAAQKRRHLASAYFW
jgi:hypothetical protein